MNRMKTTLSAAAAALLLTAGLASAQGVLPDRATLVTVSAPVTIPGITLPAGTYLFRLADSMANRNIVQIFDKDRTKIFATLLAVPAERSEVTDESVVTFKETPSDRPPAVHFWYYAGEKSGQEFAYPKDQAILIANASGQSVAVVAGNYASDIEGMKSADVSRVEPNAAATPAPAAQPTQAQAAPAPTPTEPQSAAPATPATPAREMQPTGTSGRTTPAEKSAELPKTASELPLVGLLGLFALGGAIAVRVLRRPVA